MSTTTPAESRPADAAPLRPILPTSARGATRKLRAAAIVAVVIAVGAGMLAAVNRSASGDPEADAAPVEPAEPEPVVVTVAPVTLRPIQRRVEVVGTFYGHDEVTIAAKVGGRVARIAQDVGDIVRPGDALLEIDETDYRLAVSEAERALGLELAKLGLSDLPGGRFNIQALPAVERADLLRQNAETMLERVERLSQRKATSQEQVDQARTDYRVAEANARQARLDAEQTLAAIRHKEALLATARQRLDDAKLLVPDVSAVAAPSAGPLALVSAESPADEPPVEYVVAERMVSEGEMIQATPPTAAFRLVTDQPLKFKATVPERYVGEIRNGQRVELSVEAYPGEVFSGTVARINPTVDRTNRAFRIEIHVPNSDRRLRPGSFAKASVLTREDPSVPTVPAESVVKFAGVTKVFIVDEGKARAVPLNPGVRLNVVGATRTETWIEALGPIPPGEQVVTTGHSQLSEGTPIRIRGE